MWCSLFSLRGGAHVSPLVVCRLLLVLDYMLYQFSGPVAELTEQVCSKAAVLTFSSVILMSVSCYNINSILLRGQLVLYWS